MGHRTRLGLIVRARGLGERFGRVDLPRGFGRCHWQWLRKTVFGPPRTNRLD